MLDGQQRYGRDIPLRHNYHAPRKGKHNLPFDPAMPDGTAERRFAQAGGIVLANWKPDLDWSKATGSDQGVDARIRTTARNIKAVGPHKVMLVLHHEPENDVKLPAGTGPCPSYRGTVRSNTPANYRAMWANVQKIFRAEGATNVVWVMNYMGFARWDCLVKDLWPENPHTGTRVDWIAFDLYSHGTSWNETIGRFYNWLGANQDPSHPFGSKPYMLGEFGAGTTDQAFVYGWYDQAKQALDAGTFPNLRAYVVFDACREVDLRTNHARGAGCSGALDPTEQEHFNRFVQHPLLCRALCSQGRVSPTGAADPESGSGGQHELSADPV